MKQILDELQDNKGNLVWLKLVNNETIRVGIHEIDIVANTVKVIIGKGLRELQELSKNSKSLAEDERAIIENPDNFSVFPISNILEVTA